MRRKSIWDLTRVSCAGNPRGLLQPASLPGDIGGRSSEGRADNLGGVGRGRVWIVFKFRESFKKK